jgi:hypothetical protein
VYKKLVHGCDECLTRSTQTELTMTEWYDMTPFTYLRMMLFSESFLTLSRPKVMVFTDIIEEVSWLVI